MLRRNILRCILAVSVLSALFFFGRIGLSESLITVDRSDDILRVGEVLRININVSVPEGYEVDLPEKEDVLGDFYVLSRRRRAPGFFIRDLYRIEYELVTYDTGELLIPPIRLPLRKRDQTRIIETDPIKIEVKSLLTADSRDIRPAKGLAGRTFFGKKHFPVLLLGMGLLLLVVYFLYKSKQSSYARGRKGEMDPDEEAFKLLLKLRNENLPKKGLTKEYYFRLSLIVRRYLEKRFFLRAPEMTTEEFLKEAERSNLLKEEQKSLLKDFLEKSDLVKFAEYGPRPIEIVDSYNAAVKLVRETKQQEDKKG